MGIALGALLSAGGTDAGAEEEEQAQTRQEVQAPQPDRATARPPEPTRDLFDLLRELRHKPEPPAPGPEDYRRWMIAAAPVLTYGPTSGFGIGVAGNMAVFKGYPETTRISSIVAGATGTTWELYDTRSDFGLANDLAAKNPPKLAQMQALFLKEAVKYRVLPIDDRLLERTNATLVGRPDLMGGRTSLTVYAGMTGMSENVFINTKNRWHTITAEVTIPPGGANGVVAEGRIERTQPMVFSADEGADVGEDGETPVVEDYGIPAPYKFNGTIAKVTLDIKPMQAADKAAEGQAAAEAAFKKKAAE